jgi:hypothetical protein
MRPYIALAVPWLVACPPQPEPDPEDTDTDEPIDTDEPDDTDDTGPSNTPPTADAGADVEVWLGYPTPLDGGFSSDVDGDPLTFVWSVVQRPPLSVATPTEPTAESTTFTGDVVGTYEIELTVDDGQDTDTDRLNVSVIEIPCELPVDAFPVPVDEGTSRFPEIDDSTIEIPFDLDFSFTFFDEIYHSVFVNTNGGLTFGAGSDAYDLAANEVDMPGIGVFWGDLDAGSTSTSEQRANQLAWRQCADRFEVVYQAFQDNDNEGQTNTATVTLWPDGRIDVDYGQVLSQDILVGLWNGEHTDDRTAAVTALPAHYASNGTGTLLFDVHGDSDEPGTQLNDRVLRWTP